MFDDLIAQKGHHFNYHIKALENNYIDWIIITGDI